ncbi:DUF924 family protein [Colwellia hornerae]|uniref:DUF924 domain-containing protein n=1 Tax=Colwellia hornerae TaxID=89402 RepID=A0A5C6QSB7_9GAMM|nr:DUF924 family protein [Colwellia hornerae]TWX57668.1 DUF924 domain-containing protein [Colwellia hornerae]TWX62601.1 DUF924 domain-containing protein [Colwellia hornerae]TWX71512.1 DUF924 domain-containing protein [Colwellia hornerae]
MNADNVLNFWFKEVKQSQWWLKDLAFDACISRKFSAVHQAANSGELFKWRLTAKGRLAEIIILDQFSRNIYRDAPGAFACDPLALGLAQEAIAVGADQALNNIERNFLYMPFMHSESLVIHEIAVKLFAENGVASSINFENKHKIIIEKFGRYPHRNKILNRESSQAEREFLTQANSSF